MSRKDAAGLAVFFLIAFGVPWAGWTLLADRDLPYWLLPISCSLAGFAASYAEGGTNGLRNFCRKTLHFRGTLKYILLGALIPLSLGFLYLLSNGVALSQFHLSLKPGLGTMLAMGFVTGPLAEEFGWRGYLQSKLLNHARPIWAVLAVGTIWCSWHIPIFYSSVFGTPQSSLGFLAFCITWSMFLAYLVPSSKGSVWPAVALHWSVNAHAAILSTLFPSVDGSQLPGGSNTTLLYGLAAIAFVAMRWRFFTEPAASRATSNNSCMDSSVK